MDWSVAQLLVSVLVADMDTWVKDEADFLAANDDVGLGLKKLVTSASLNFVVSKNSHGFADIIFMVEGLCFLDFLATVADADVSWCIV